MNIVNFFFFFSSRRRHTRCLSDWSSDVCSSDLPVDIIESYGADALRFTLTQMATETQDVRLPVKKLADGRNTSEKFDTGRNFANKLWNASRFAIANLASIAAEDIDEKSWSIVDRWILSRLMRTIQEAD